MDNSKDDIELDSDFVKFSIPNHETLYAYKLLMQPDTILKIKDSSKNYVIPLNKVFFEDCQIFKKSKKTTEKIAVPNSNSKKTSTSQEFTVYNLSNYPASAVKKYLHHYFLKLHCPNFKLEPTIDDCNELLRLAEFCDDKEVKEASHTFFKNNIQIGNLKDAIKIRHFVH